MEEVRFSEPVYHLMLVGDFLGVIFIFILIFWIADNIQTCRKTAAKWNRSIRKRSQRLSSTQLWTCSTGSEQIDSPNKITISRSNSKGLDQELGSIPSFTDHEVPQGLGGRNMSVVSERSTTSVVSYDPNQRTSIGSISLQSSGPLGGSVEGAGPNVKPLGTTLPDLYVQLSDSQLQEMVEEKKNRDNLEGSQGPFVDPHLVCRRLEVLPEMSEQSSIQSNLVLNFPVSSRNRE
ncbi:uncharacterized protein LOC131881329 [Tigriopus californicus]|uniref:uncharacterized protein LOC131881329 n=1 Tax=Tigriopus californicus TaxID=6832 RepID=UPI0027DA75C0|nr:uncharacterized protein LOC131881329 [Tigriopus californicus]